MTIQPGARLGPYEIVAPIGAGGMGEVWRARDTRLDRDVAIKVLPPGFAQSATHRQRFEREAKAISQLNHPHVCTLFDVGEEKVAGSGPQESGGQADGVDTALHAPSTVLYLVMEYLEGESLADRIKKSPLSLHEALAYGQQIASALDAAHRQGITHRDLKPGNIMLTASGAKLLDFGLAKLNRPAETGAVDRDAPTIARDFLTEVGTTLGTVAYMSPEQARGEAVDARSDIFSLGVVLYEMATGRRPFQGKSTADLFAAILGQEPAPPRTLRAEIPTRLEDVILKALDKDMALRYQSAAGLRGDLVRQERDASAASRGDATGTPVRDEGQGLSGNVSPASRRGAWIGVAVVVVALLAGVGYLAWRGTTPGATPGGTAMNEGKTIQSRETVAATADRSIAVLAFADMSENKDQEYFADGLAEELMGMLSRVPTLKVAARTSSFYFKGKQATTAEIAKTLGVSHLLEGSVRKSGDRLRVNAQLVRADDGFQLWSETFDRQLDDVFKVQDEIATAVVRALELTLLERDMPKSTPTHSQEAYALFLQARQLHYRGTHADNLTGIAYLERALELDPKFAPAWFGLGDALIYDYVQFGSGTHAEVRRRAGEAAETALRLDPNLADAHLLKGRVLADLDWNWPAADVEIQRALELDPNNMLALWQASCYALVGDRLDEALRYAERVRAVDAISWGSYWAMGDVQWRLGRVADAEASYRKSTELSPTSSPMHTMLGITLLRQGRPAEALKAIELETDDGWKLYGLALTFDALGRSADADRALARLETMADSRAWSIGSVYACRQQPDRAFSWLDRAWRQRDGQLPLIQADPCVGFLERDPRYAELRRKVNLPVSTQGSGLESAGLVTGRGRSEN